MEQKYWLAANWEVLTCIAGAVCGETRLLDCSTGSTTVCRPTALHIHVWDQGCKQPIQDKASHFRNPNLKRHVYEPSCVYSPCRVSTTSVRHVTHSLSTQCLPRQYHTSTKMLFTHSPCRISATSVCTKMLLTHTTLKDKPPDDKSRQHPKVFPGGPPPQY